jgi:hypothetical protein
MKRRGRIKPSGDLEPDAVFQFLELRANQIDSHPASGEGFTGLDLAGSINGDVK